jgi:hypothetical protein
MEKTLLKLGTFSFIFEHGPMKGIWVLLPSVIYFHNDSDGNKDLTFAFLCGGLTLRLE